MLEVTVSGSATLKSVAAQIRAAGDKGLGREMSTALQRAASPIKAQVTEEYSSGLPSSGGYANTFTRSMTWRTTVRGAARTASFRLLLFGEGASQRRDIERIEAGTLRHPVYGRSRRVRSGPRAGTALSNPWATTKIRGGYWQRGTSDAANDAEKEMAQVLAEFARRLAG